MPVQLSPCFDAALSYLARGWSVIALCPHDHHGVSGQHQKDCTTPGKRPLWPWKDYQGRLPRQTEIKLYWNKNKNSNVGIVMGPISGLIGLDIDGAAGEQMLNDIAAGDFPPTLEFTTPSGGRRLLFKWPESGAPIKSFPAEDGSEALRILSLGSQTAAPPSIHATGGTYQWVPGHGPGEIEPAPCPHWLLDIAKPKPISSEECHDLPTPTHDINRAKAYLGKCEPAIAGQGGHNQTFKVACKLVKGFALPEEDALQLLLTEFNPRCVPPWTEGELRHKVQDALKSNGEVGTMYANSNGNGHALTPKPIPKPTVINLATITKKPVEWLWPGWIPLGKLAVLDGDPDLGKSTLLLDIAARVTTTGVMPNGSQGITGNVVILSAEDDVADTILPRLQAAQANIDRIKAITEIRGEPPVLPTHIPDLQKVVEETQARLIIIDPLTAYLAVDTKSDQEIRRALHPLAKMAQKTRCAVVYLRHLNKGTGTKAIYRGGGSIAIIGAARAGLLVAADPQQPNNKVLALSKHNLSSPQASLRYQLDYLPEFGVCRVNWQGQSSMSADDLLQPNDTPEDKTAKEEAMQLLQGLLEIGPRPATECYEAGRKLKIADYTMRKAKLALGILSVQQHDQKGEFKTVVWKLPD